MTRWPIIFFQVNSIGSWGKNKVEAYGFCDIPNIPGYHELEIRTWKAKESIQDQINSFYLGIFPSLIRSKYFFKKGDPSN